MSETLTQVSILHPPSSNLVPPTVSSAPFHQLPRSPPHSPEQVGTLVGHNGWVTSIAFTPNTNEDTMNMLVSCSRDKTLLKWDLTRQQGEDYGHPRLLMRGHSNFVQVRCMRGDVAAAM